MISCHVYNNICIDNKRTGWKKLTSVDFLGLLKILTSRLSLKDYVWTGLFKGQLQFSLKVGRITTLIAWFNSFIVVSNLSVNLIMLCLRRCLTVESCNVGNLRFGVA